MAAKLGFIKLCNYQQNDITSSSLGTFARMHHQPLQETQKREEINAQVLTKSTPIFFSCTTGYF